MLALAAGAQDARAQDIEPRAYSNAPIGVNFLVAGYAYTRGGLAFDSALPITDPELTTSNAVAAYARVIAIAGQSARIEAIVPYAWLSGSAIYKGEPVERVVEGFTNAAFRLSVNLYGAPALSLKEFAGWEQDLIVGASLRVTVPWGQYDNTRVVNIGTNRWSFKPEIGVSKAVGNWTFELTGAVTFFTDNDEFFGGVTRKQDPLFTFQAHVSYTIKPSLWVALDATFYSGGQTTVGGNLNQDFQENSRVGLTASYPVARGHSVKLSVATGATTRSGQDFNTIGLAWQYMWLDGAKK